MPKAGDLLTGNNVFSTNGMFNLSFEFVNPEQWNNWFAADEQFEENFKKLFQQMVFVIHKYLIRVTPVRTGRLRAGWTAILEKYQQDYSAAFADTSLVALKVTTESLFDQTAITLGKSESQFLDSELDVAIINNVPYGEFVEFGTSKMEPQYFTQRSAYKGEYIAKKAVDDWFKEIAAKGEISEPGHIEEVAA